MTRIGVASFSDGRPRVQDDLRFVIERREKEICEFLTGHQGIEAVRASQVVGNPESARAVARELLAKDVAGVICNLPVFAFPNYLISTVRILRLPVLLYSPTDPSLPGLGGLLAAAGGLKQIGVDPFRVWGSLNSPGTRSALMRFVRAAGIRKKLEGSVYGLIGGRSMGMYTGMSNTDQWQALFGIDIEHVDQSEIIRLASSFSEAVVDEGVKWLSENCKAVCYDSRKLTPQTLRMQIRSYLAIEELKQQLHLDFVGVKCHPDLSETFVTQCVPCTLFNDPYDWRGPKESVVFSCEADSDGALTMHILRLLAEKPSCLLDIRHFDSEENLYFLCNCGAMPTWFARRSDRPEENLKEVSLLPTIAKYRAGGAHVQFIAEPGPVTCARLSRDAAGYTMHILTGEVVKQPQERTRESCPAWPHAFVRLGIEPETLITSYNSNHIHMVDGWYKEDLADVCRILGIAPKFLQASIRGGEPSLSGA